MDEIKENDDWNIDYDKKILRFANQLYITCEYCNKYQIGFVNYDAIQSNVNVLLLFLL